MSSNSPVAARCTFYRREQANDVPEYHYDRIWTYEDVRTAHVPLVGDLVYLNDYSPRKLTGGYVVVARSWIYPEYGSRSWPTGQPYPDDGPLVDIIVEAAVGPFINQVLREGEDA